MLRFRSILTILKIIPAFFLLALLTDCASTEMLPESAAEIDFRDETEGKIDWSRYREVASFAGVTVDDVTQAAKAGLAEAGFALLKADRRKQAIFGEHGITLHDWNVIAAVYYKPTEDKVDVVVIVQASTDTGFSGDVTGDAWTGKILIGMRRFLERQRK